MTAALGDKIGITIIATGFEYKDPFKREQKPEAPKKEEKIVMPLQMPGQETYETEGDPVVEMITNEKPLVATLLQSKLEIPAARLVRRNGTQTGGNTGDDPPAIFKNRTYGRDARSC